MRPHAVPEGDRQRAVVRQAVRLLRRHPAPPRPPPQDAQPKGDQLVTRLILLVDNRIAFRFGFGQIIRSEYSAETLSVLISCFGVRQKQLISAKIDILGQNTLFWMNDHWPKYLYFAKMTLFWLKQGISGK